MGFISLLFIAFSLAMDAFSVAVTDGMIIQKPILPKALKIGAFFGIFQAFMPILGWALGMGFIKYITAIDHWIAFGLLAFIGINMVIEAFKNEEDEKDDKDPMAFKTLTLLAIATSIDALAVGITFATVGAYMSIFVSAGIIGAVAFLCSGAGVYIGRKFGDLFGSRAELLGGTVLIIIGIKILVEHLFF